MHAIPLALEDFLKPERVALVMWDMQKGLGGKAVGSEAIVANARRLIESAERLNIPVIWSQHIAPPFEMTTGPFMLWLMKKRHIQKSSSASVAPSVSAWVVSAARLD